MGEDATLPLLHESLGRLMAMCVGTGAAFMDGRRPRGVAT